MSTRRNDFTDVSKQVGRYYPATLAETLYIVGDSYQRGGDNGNFKVGEEQAHTKPGKLKSAKPVQIHGDADAVVMRWSLKPLR